LGGRPFLLIVDKLVDTWGVKLFTPFPSRAHLGYLPIWQRLEHRTVNESKSIPAMLVEEQIEKYELPTIKEGFDYLIKKL